MSLSTDSMRCLVACAACRKQFDATKLAHGSKFRCSCGELVEVPRFRPHDAAVVRCSSCSAPRMRDSAACEHCSAEYTVHERDMHTLCASCMTRISDRARFCHHCATPVQPNDVAGKQTKHPCPVCGRRHKLIERSLGEAGTTISECRSCAGVWLDLAAFQLLTDRARNQQVDDVALDLPDAAPAGDRPDTSNTFYRKCPRCNAMMNRRNFGQRSGVVIDACKEHGLWFDASELSSILQWIRKGGEARAAGKEAEAERHRERMTRIRIDRPTADDGGTRRQLSWGPAAPTSIDSLPDLLAHLFDL